MSTTLSAKVKAALFARETSGAAIMLLTISHPSVSTIYITNNTVPLTYGGHTYAAVPFVLDWHAETSSEVASATLTTYNSDELISALRFVGDFLHQRFVLNHAKCPGLHIHRAWCLDAGFD